MLQNALYDIKLDGQLYGCHSCRWGGVQWVTKVPGKLMQKIYDWGKWSKDDSHPIIVKQIFSWIDDTDEPTNEPLENF